MDNKSALPSMALCYGENRRQGNAGLFIDSLAVDDPFSLDKFKLVEGNPPSYINMTDVHRLIETATRIGAAWELNFGHVPLIAIAVKHGNACGVGVGEYAIEVTRKMISGDPEAISGGLILFNFTVDAEVARLLRQYLMPEENQRILDSVIAPSFDQDAIEMLARKKTGKCRIFTNPKLAGTDLGLSSIDATRRFRQVRGGRLQQDGDPFVLRIPEEWKSKLSEMQQQNLVLGWAIGSTSNSNTITLTAIRMLLGSGVNQRSRVKAAQVALLYARDYGHDTKGAVAYSDSFFPFPDGPQVLIDAGISVIFATSGSINDALVMKSCTDQGVTLLQLPDAEARGFYGH